MSRVIQLLLFHTACEFFYIKQQDDTPSLKVTLKSKLNLIGSLRFSAHSPPLLLESIVVKGMNCGQTGGVLSKHWQTGPK